MGWGLAESGWDDAAFIPLRNGSQRGLLLPPGQSGERRAEGSWRRAAVPWVHPSASHSVTRTQNPQELHPQLSRQPR